MSKVLKAMERFRRERMQDVGDSKAATIPASLGLMSEAAPAPDFPASTPVSPEEDPDLVAFSRPPGPKPSTKRMKTGRFGIPDEHLVSLVAPRSLETEPYRSLRYVVEQLKQRRQMKIVAVTSPTAGDGKTLTALNLAGVLATGNQDPVLIVDADLRRPTVADYLQMISGNRGLVEAVSRADQDLVDYAQMHPRFNLAVFPAGSETDSPYEMLKSARLGSIFDEARRNFSYTVVDCPPLLPYPDCRLIQKHVDGVLVVIRADRTPRKLVEDGLRALESEKMVGFVFNGDNHNVDKYYRKGGYTRARKRGA